jgi:hypothetical protein
MMPIVQTYEYLLSCFQPSKIHVAITRAEQIFKNAMQNKLNYNELRSTIFEAFPLLHSSSQEAKKLMNLTIFSHTTLKSWYLAEKVLQHPGSTHITQGNMVHILWEAIHADCIKIVNVILEKHITKLRKRDVEAAIIFLNPELGSIDAHAFETNIRVRFIKAKLAQKEP